jgi:hypothetical protein
MKGSGCYTCENHYCVTYNILSITPFQHPRMSFIITAHTAFFLQAIGFDHTTRRGYLVYLTWWLASSSFKYTNIIDYYVLFVLHKLANLSPPPFLSSLPFPHTWRPRLPFSTLTPSLAHCQLECLLPNTASSGNAPNPSLLWLGQFRPGP